MSTFLQPRFPCFFVAGFSSAQLQQTINTGEAPVAHTFSKGFSASKMNPSNLSK